MAFSCVRRRRRRKSPDDDRRRNIELEKRLKETNESEDMELIGMNLTDKDIPLIIDKVIKTKKKKKYRSLSLSTNEITFHGIELLINHLKTNSKLTHLNLSSNPIGDQSILLINEFIQNNQTIYHLSLSNTNLTDHGIQSLLQILQSNTISLRSLDLRSNPLITDLSIEAFMQMAEQNQILSACRLDNCGLSEHGKNQLKQIKSIQW